MNETLTSFFVSIGDGADNEIPVSLCISNLTQSQNIFLIIYGGSTGFNQGKLTNFKKRLSLNGISTASFDFRGITEATKNHFFKFGLSSRVKDTRAVITEIKKRLPDYNISLIGVSMGGYIAAQCLDLEIKNLILAAPAAYHKNAIEKNITFGSDFSKLIRKQSSWRESDAFEKVKKFKGRILIIGYENDEIIPFDVLKKYFNSATSKDRSFIIVKGYEHRGTFEGKKLAIFSRILISWIKSRN